MAGEATQERDVIAFSDDEGNELLLEVQDYFFYNGEEYALLREPGWREASAPEEAEGYIMAVRSYTDENGEEMEEFSVPDEALLETLIGVVKTRFTIPEEA